MYLSPEEKAVGQGNFNSAIGVTRRDFLKTGIAAGAVSGAGLGAMYFGYEATVANPLRVGVIGTGDEGSVLLGGHHARATSQVVAIADIRPYNIHRAFHGDHSSENALRVRSGLMKKYGWKTEDEARKHVKVYDAGLPRPAQGSGRRGRGDRPAAALARPGGDRGHAGRQARADRKADGPQRPRVQGDGPHLETTEQDSGHRPSATLQHFVRQRGRHDPPRADRRDPQHSRPVAPRQLAGHDSWSMPLPDDKMGQRIASLKRNLETAKGLAIDKLSKDIARLTALRRDMEAARASTVEGLEHEIDQLSLQYLDSAVKAENYGYEEITLADGKRRSALEELIRWRLWNRTGGGLMAELGSHQMDAAGIFISGLRADGEKALPLTVSAVGGRSLFPLDRDCEDHVYCVYEFPAPGYESDPNKKIGVTYSSINGNGFGGYGETVMGTKGTLILEREQEVMLFSSSAPTTTSVSVAKGKNGPTLDTTQSGGGEAAAVGKKALEGPVSRGYTEELEHWAWCIRNPDPKHLPRCHPKVAMGDAVIALVTNISIREGRRIEFQKEWFDIDSDETPEGIKPDVERYKV